MLPTWRGIALADVTHHCGLRYGQAAPLRSRDFDIEGQRFNVSNSMTHGSGPKGLANAYVEGTTKNRTG